MDKTVLADVEANVGDDSFFAGGKEDEIAEAQLLFGDGTPGAVLLLRNTGEIQSVETITDHRQSAAIKAALIRHAPPAIGDAQVASSGLNQFIAQITAVGLVDAGNGILLRGDDIKIGNHPLFSESDGFRLSLSPLFEITESHLVKTGVVAKVERVDPAAVEFTIEADGVIEMGKGADLDGVAEAWQ